MSEFSTVIHNMLNSVQFGKDQGKFLLEAFFVIVTP